MKGWIGETALEACKPDVKMPRVIFYILSGGENCWLLVKKQVCKGFFFLKKTSDPHGYHLLPFYFLKLYSMVSWGLHVKIYQFIYESLALTLYIHTVGEVSGSSESPQFPVDQVISSFSTKVGDGEVMTKSGVGKRNKSPISHNHNQLDALVQQQAAVGSISSGWMRFFTSFRSNFEWQHGSACHHSYLLTLVSPWDLLHRKLLRFCECHQHKEDRAK